MHNAQSVGHANRSDAGTSEHHMTSKTPPMALGLFPFFREVEVGGLPVLIHTQNIENLQFP